MDRDTYSQLNIWFGNVIYVCKTNSFNVFIITAICYWFGNKDMVYTCDSGTKTFLFVLKPIVGVNTYGLLYFIVSGYILKNKYCPEYFCYSH
jgi:hypothetical protein